MGRMQAYVDMVAASKLLAPNLKSMTLKLYTGRRHRGNDLAREVVRNHLLALRWMNPNAVVYLREERGQGTPEIEYELWTGGGKTMELKKGAACRDAHEAVAKVLMAARDPADDAPPAAVEAALAAVGAGGAASGSEGVRGSSSSGSGADAVPAGAPLTSTPHRDGGDALASRPLPTSGGPAARSGARAFSTASARGALR